MYTIQLAVSYVITLTCRALSHERDPFFVKIIYTARATYLIYPYVSVCVRVFLFVDKYAYNSIYC